jgi:uncharacterized protein
MRTNNEPWYKDGLRFECTGCGDCCSGAPGFVWVNKAEIEGLAQAIRVDVAEFERRYVRQVGIRKSLIERANGDCVFLHADSRTCQVYNERPRQCRTFPFWRSNLANPEAWQAVCDVCPGCNRGKVVPLAEIQKRAEVMEL